MPNFLAKIRSLPATIKQAWNNQDEIAELSDKIVVSKAVGPGDAEPKQITARAAHAGMVYNPSYSTVYGEETYTPQEYNMAVVANCIDTDSYFRRAVEKYVELIWKSDYKFIGKNVRAVNYVRRRFEQIAMATNCPTDELFHQLSYQLVTYGNVYVSKVRQDNASGGNYRKTYTDQLLAPVAGYFVEDTVSMFLAVKENGDPIGYQQRIPRTTKYKIWRPWNMIHMYYSRKPGLRVGTPLVWPVLDDLRALRKMEQNVELLVYQHTIPLFQYKIGTEQKPAQDIEITQTKAVVEKMPPNGCIVTPERHEIIAIGVERSAVDVAVYLEYFKNRVFSGLGMSAVGLGEGGTANRGTAIVVDQHLHNTTETFQRLLKMFIDEYIIKELLSEGGYVYDATDEDNKVELYFPPVNQEVQFSKENHYAQMYAQHVLTETEVRQEFGRDPIKEEEREDMYLDHVARELEIMKPGEVTLENAQHQTTVTKTTTAGNTTTKRTTKLPPGQTKMPAGGVGANRNQPANQYGTQRAKPRIPRNDELYTKMTGIFQATLEDTVQAFQDYMTQDTYAPSALAQVRKTIFDRSGKDLEFLVQRRDDLAESMYLIDKNKQLMVEIFDKVAPIFHSKNSYDGMNQITATFATAKHKFESVFDFCVPEKQGGVDGD